MFYEEDFVHLLQNLPEKFESSLLPEIFPGLKEEHFLHHIQSGNLQAVYKNKTWYVTREGLIQFVQEHSILNEE
jgi:hypothetical protein